LTGVTQTCNPILGLPSFDYTGIATTTSLGLGYNPNNGFAATIGQTFNANASTITSFSFNMAGADGNPNFHVKAYLYAWDLINLHPSGPALYTSDFFFVAAYSRTYSFSGFCVPVSVGQEYVIF